MVCWPENLRFVTISDLRRDIRSRQNENLEIRREMHCINQELIIAETTENQSHPKV